MFFESGGIVQHIILTILASVGTDLTIITQPYTLLNRYVLAPFALSQHQLNKLWRPPAMPLGKIYAFALRTISVALIWAPLNPIVLPLTAFMLWVSFWSLRVAVAFWCGHSAMRRPACARPSPSSPPWPLRLTPTPTRTPA